LALLPHRQCGEKNGYDSILSKRDPELWVTGDLKNEISISSLVQQVTLRQRSEWKAAQYKGSRTKAQVLPTLFPVAANQLDALDFSHLPL
jgi:hypothetical protein